MIISVGLATCISRVRNVHNLRRIKFVDLFLELEAEPDRVEEFFLPEEADLESQQWQLWLFGVTWTLRFSLTVKFETTFKPVIRFFAFFSISSTFFSKKA